MTGLQYSQFLYRYALDWSLKWGVFKSELAAEFASRPIKYNFLILPLETMVRVYGNVMGRFFYSEGILTEENAQNLALEYAKSFEESAKRNLSDQYNSKLLAIGEGFIGFLLSHITMSPEKGWRFAIFYGDTWLLETLEYGP
ncbi:uncharacterized protein NPIL_277881, partial [Nephila pilipes]